MAKLLLLFVICVGLLPVAVQAQENTEFIPGEVWKDTDGNPINAHGGGLLYHNGTYYWYGEYKKGKTVLPEWATWECYRTDVTGVGCYSSKDLLNWKFEGIVLPAVKNDPDHDLHPSKVLERPKVVYNKKTGKFVMWAHVESADYSKACAGVAVSDSPVGPFIYQGSFRPNNAMSRDQTVFVDDDGRAYQFYSSENNATMYISLLTDDYLKPSGRFTRNFVKESREAPAVFKYDGKYYMLSSGCTGWDPNVAEIAVADSIMGTWKTIGNPCTGPDADKTFYAQSTYVQPVIGKKDAYIAMFDLVGGREVGVFGQIHPLVAQNYGADADLYCAELSFDALCAAKGADPQYVPLPKFPAVTRDIAVVCGEEITVGALESAIKEGAHGLLKEVKLFDIYQGKGVAEGKKSVAFNLVLRADDRSLTAEEADNDVKAILATLEAKCGAVLR